MKRNGFSIEIIPAISPTHSPPNKSDVLEMISHSLYIFQKKKNEKNKFFDVFRRRLRENAFSFPSIHNINIKLVVSRMRIIEDIR